MKNAAVLLVLFSAVSLSAQIEVVSGGNVGIGTTSPTEKLHVAQAASADLATRLRLTASAGRQSTIILDDAGSNGFALGRDFLNTGVHDFVLFDRVAGAARLYVNASGNIGIGTTGPATSGGGGSPRTLEVQGASGQTVPWGQLVLSTPGAAAANDVLGGVEFAARGATYQRAGYIYSFKEDNSTTAANARLEFGVTNGSTAYTAMTVRGSGNVGIGTAAPTARFQVTDSTSTLRFGYNLSSGSGGPSLMLETAANVYSDVVFNTYGADQVRFRGSAYGLAIGGSNPRLNIGFSDANYTSAALVVNGNVGIGTTSPSQKLEVAGSIRATSFIADSNTYADFVFEPGYRLPTLSEVEAHIQKEGHLPGIPSETEAKAHGIDLASMQVKLLQKVEELTLHAIAQEKRANEQARTIAALEAKVAELSR